MPDGQLLSGYPDQGQHPNAGAWQQILLLDGPSALDVGWWVPWAPYSKGSLDVSGTFSGTVEALVSNAATMPANGYTITIAGTVHENDVIGCTVAYSGSVGGGVHAAYTVLSGDNADNVATGLAAAISAALEAQPVIPDTYAQTTQNASIGADSIQVIIPSGALNTIQVLTQEPYQSLTVVTNVTGAGATTTAAVTQYDDGSGFEFVTTTTAGNTVINQPGAWIKGKVSSYSSGSPTAILVGVIS